MNGNGKNKKASSLAEAKSEHQAKRSVMPILPEGKIQGIFALNKRIGRSPEKIFKKIFRDDFSGLFARVTCRRRFPRRAKALLGMTKEGRLPLELRSFAMTIFTLTITAVFSIGVVGEARAENILSPTGSCGDGCLYEITQNTDGTQNLRVYNNPEYTGSTKKIAYNAFRGSGKNTAGNYSETYTNATFNKIIIDGDFDSIGSEAFWHNGASEVVFNGSVKTIGSYAFGFNNFTSVDLPQGLESIGVGAFYANRISSIVIPDSVTSIGSYAFHSGNVTDVYISDTLDSLGHNYPFGSHQRPNIICKGDVEKCQSLVKEIKDYRATETAGLENYVIPANQSQCTGNKYFWNGISCSRKELYCDNNMYYTGSECIMRPENGGDIVCDYEGSGYVKVGDSCASPEVTYAKKRYTPAEANQWLKDNDNSVTITFRK